MPTIADTAVFGIFFISLQYFYAALHSCFDPMKDGGVFTEK